MKRPTHKSFFYSKRTITHFLPIVAQTRLKRFNLKKSTFPKDINTVLGTNKEQTTLFKKKITEY